MNFLADNIGWFIGGTVVILLTVIGYFAEKTDFGRKKGNSKAEENATPVVEQPVIENNTNFVDTVTPSTFFDATVPVELDSIPADVPSELFAPIDGSDPISSVQASNFDFSLSEEININNETINTPVLEEIVPVSEDVMNVGIPDLAIDSIATGEIAFPILEESTDLKTSEEIINTPVIEGINDSLSTGVLPTSEMIELTPAIHNESSSDTVIPVLDELTDLPISETVSSNEIIDMVEDSINPIVDIPTIDNITIPALEELSDLPIVEDAPAEVVEESLMSEAISESSDIIASPNLEAYEPEIVDSSEIIESPILDEQTEIIEPIMSEELVIEEIVSAIEPSQAEENLMQAPEIIEETLIIEESQKTPEIIDETLSVETLNPEELINSMVPATMEALPDENVEVVEKEVETDLIDTGVDVFDNLMTLPTMVETNSVEEIVSEDAIKETVATEVSMESAFEDLMTLPTQSEVIENNELESISSETIELAPIVDEISIPALETVSEQLNVEVPTINTEVMTEESQNVPPISEEIVTELPIEEKADDSIDVEVIEAVPEINIEEEVSDDIVNTLLADAMTVPLAEESPVVEDTVSEAINNIEAEETTTLEIVEPTPVEPEISVSEDFKEVENEQLVVPELKEELPVGEIVVESQIEVEIPIETSNVEEIQTTDINLPNIDSYMDSTLVEAESIVEENPIDTSLEVEYQTSPTIEMSEEVENAIEDSEEESESGTPLIPKLNDQLIPSSLINVEEASFDEKIKNDNDSEEMDVVDIELPNIDDYVASMDDEIVIDSLDDETEAIVEENPIDVALIPEIEDEPRLTVEATEETMNFIKEDKETASIKENIQPFDLTIPSMDNYEDVQDLQIEAPTLLTPLVDSVDNVVYKDSEGTINIEPSFADNIMEQSEPTTNFLSEHSIEKESKEPIIIIEEHSYVDKDDEKIVYIDLLEEHEMFPEVDIFDEENAFGEEPIIISLSEEPLSSTVFQESEGIDYDDQWDF